jgi:hypothetical protein
MRQVAAIEQAVRIEIPRANASTDGRRLQNDLAKKMSCGGVALKPMAELLA